MTTTAASLKASLWQCAEVLRGSAVDRTDWKAWVYCNGVNETFTDQTYNGFFRRTRVSRRQTSSTPMYDYVTVTVTAGRDTLNASAKKTTIIALF